MKILSNKRIKNESIDGIRTLCIMENADFLLAATLPTELTMMTKYFSKPRLTSEYATNVFWFQSLQTKKINMVIRSMQHYNNVYRWGANPYFNCQCWQFHGVPGSVV